MMEAAGPSSPFDFNGDFYISEFVTSPPDNDIATHNNDDFMASFSLDGGGGADNVDQHSSSSSSHFNHQDSTTTASAEYPSLSISQLQQLHSQIQQQSSPSSSASPSVHVDSGPPPPPPSESDLQSILDGLIHNNNNNTQGLVDVGNIDLGSLMGQLAGMGQQNNGGGGHHQQQRQEGPSAFASPPPQLQLQHGQEDSTATALQRLQQLQQLQQYQSQFIQQQLDQLTRQAAEQQQKNQQQQQQQQHLFQAQPPPQHSSHLLQSQQQQQHVNHFRSNSIDHSNSNLNLHQGLPTPAHSSELYAISHQEMVSPIHLPGGAAGRYRDSNEYDLDGNLLFTPLMSPAMSQSNQTTPGSTLQPINSLTHTPSADFFSPLTSPALGPVFHSSDYNRVSNSNSHHQNQTNHSHNPPSMSPHLLAQNSSMSMSPHLLAQQSGMMAPGSPAQKRSTSSGGKSRSSRGTGSTSVNGGAGGPEGKHAKARPSPLMKPIGSTSTSRRKKDSLGGSMPSPRLPLMSPQLPMDGIGEMEISESSHPSSSSSNNYFPHPSPSANPYGQHANNLIPSAVPHIVDQGSSGSNSSPSPVDLASLQMPPPPVPTAQQRRLSASSNYSNGSGSSSMASSIAPQTPATFLNLSRPGLSSSTSSSSTAMNTTPVNPSPLSSPFISATDPSTYGNGNRNDHVQQHLPTNGLNGGGAPSKLPPQASSSNANSNPPRGISNTYKPPFIAPVGKGKTPGAAPKGSKKAKASDRPKPPLPSTSNSSTSTSTNKPPEVRKTSHREAEQRRRDSLKAGFDELRVLLPPINVEAFDPDTGEPIAGASMPRLPARSPLIPDDNPNRGVSKVALLRCSNKHIGLLNGRIERRDGLIERLKREVRELRGRVGDGGLISGEGEGGEGEEWEDVLDVDVDLVERDDEEYDDDEEEEDGDGNGEGGLGEVLEEDELQQEQQHQPTSSNKKSRRPSTTSNRSKQHHGNASAATKPAPRASMGRAAAAVASARLREGGGEDQEEEDGGEGMDQS